MSLSLCCTAFKSWDAQGRLRSQKPASPRIALPLLRKRTTLSFLSLISLRLTFCLYSCSHDFILIQETPPMNNSYFSICQTTFHLKSWKWQFSSLPPSLTQWVIESLHSQTALIPSWSVRFSFDWWPSTEGWKKNWCESVLFYYLLLRRLIQHYDLDLYSKHRHDWKNWIWTGFLRCRVYSVWDSKSASWYFAEEYVGQFQRTYG